MFKKIGKVILVGAGPANPELITVKGVRCLKEAQVVLYDRLVNCGVLDYVSRKAEVIYVGKTPRRHGLSQDEINRLLAQKAGEGKIVVRLKGGDPFLFGRGAEEALFLARHKIPFEVVPGVTSALAVPAYAGLPLTHRDYSSSVGIFTGQEDINKEPVRLDWEKIPAGLGTLVFLMGVENLPRIVRGIIRSGRAENTPCCLIQWGSLPWQKTISADLGTILDKARDAGVKPPAVFVAGDVVRLRSKINWYENKPLFGKRILVTSPLESSNKLALFLEDYGAVCKRLPFLEIKPLRCYSKFDSLLRRLGSFKWVIFTSQSGVKFFKERLDYLKKDIRLLGGVSIAVIGPKTKMALKEIGLRPDMEPKKFCQEGLLESFKRRKTEIKGKKVLIVSSSRSRDLLPGELRKMGSVVKTAVAYEAVLIPRAGSDIKADIDLITFTSGACVRNFFRVFGKKGFFCQDKKPLIASIGPVTSEQLNQFGIKPDIEAKHYTLEGLTEAVVKYFQ